MNERDKIEKSVHEEAERIEEEIAQWIKYAQNDYDLVSHLFYGDYYPKPLEIICYHCSQAAEKVLKALFIRLRCRGGVPKTHDIQFLLSQIKDALKDEKRVDIPSEIYDWGAELTKYSVAARYPNELNIDEPLTKEAVVHMEKFFQWVKKILD